MVELPPWQALCTWQCAWVATAGPGAGSAQVGVMGGEAGPAHLGMHLVYEVAVVMICASQS